MKLGLNLQTSLQQSLTPQQIQYLKMLQLPSLQLEQHVRAELENNPMLEEASEFEPTPEEIERVTGDTDAQTESTAYNAPPPEMHEGPRSESSTQQDAAMEFDGQDAFEFQKMLIGEDSVKGGSSDTYGIEEEEDTTFQFQDVQTLEEDLLEQLRYLVLSDEERLFGEYIIGNIDDDGYLRRDLAELIDEMNDRFTEHNLALFNIRAGSHVSAGPY
jgi:RNA polymerase sigma-54 factor